MLCALSCSKCCYLRTSFGRGLSFSACNDGPDGPGVTVETIRLLLRGDMLDFLHWDVEEALQPMTYGPAIG